MKILQHKMKEKRRGDIQRMNETDRRGMGRQEEGEKFILHFLDILGIWKGCCGIPCNEHSLSWNLMALKILLPNIICDPLFYAYNLESTILRKSTLNQSFPGNYTSQYLTP